MGGKFDKSGMTPNGIVFRFAFDFAETVGFGFDVIGDGPLDDFIFVESSICVLPLSGARSLDGAFSPPSGLT